MKRIGKKRILLLAGCTVLLVGIAGKVFLDHNIWAGGRFVSRASETLDLRGKSMEISDFEQLQAEMPECEITWDVPFQGGSFASDSRELTVSSLTQEDILTLDYFRYLTRLDASGCTDYPELMALRSRRPECGVTYQVTLGGTTYENDADTVTVEDPAAPELEELLPYLPNVTEVRLTGQMPRIAELLHLQEAFPEICFQWEVNMDGKTLESTVTELDLSGRALRYDEAEELFLWFPDLKTVNMRGCGLTDEEMMALAQMYPACFFLWDMTIGEVQVSTDAEQIDISGQPIESSEQIEALLPYFPNVNKVVMCKCGLDDETMDALNRKYEDIRFVWSVKIKDVYVRTDATYFYPFKFYHSMVVNNDDIYALRYCTDMVAIDIGHMGAVTDCEWAAFMPNLKYLVIVETAITDISPLSNLKNLVFLEIFTTNITDYTPLLGCTALEDLNLGKTYGNPDPIAQMTWLKNVWWSGVDGTYGLPCSNAKAILTEALPNTHLRFNLDSPNVDNGWRQLDNYKAMRDVMDIFYLT